MNVNKAIIKEKEQESNLLGTCSLVILVPKQSKGTSEGEKNKEIWQEQLCREKEAATTKKQGSLTLKLHRYISASVNPCQVRLPQVPVHRVGLEVGGAKKESTLPSVSRRREQPGSLTQVILSEDSLTVLSCLH